MDLLVWVQMNYQVGVNGTAQAMRNGSVPQSVIFFIQNLSSSMMFVNLLFCKLYIHYSVFCYFSLLQG